VSEYVTQIRHVNGKGEGKGMDSYDFDLLSAGKTTNLMKAIGVA
jgi:hypothetical protein